MCKKICCCFGHREVYQNIKKPLNEAIEYAVSSGCTEFLTGGMGDFDRKFTSAVCSAKTRHPDKNIKIILVKPYFSNELNTNRKYYEQIYDDIIIPESVHGVHYKKAITVRNRRMADTSDLIIAFVYRDFGGAYTSLKYAQKKGKEVINLADDFK